MKKLISLEIQTVKAVIYLIIHPRNLSGTIWDKKLHSFFFFGTTWTSRRLEHFHLR